MADDTVTDQPEDDEKESRAMDDELKILGGFIRTLAKLDLAARGRIVTYLNSRYPPAALDYLDDPRR